MFTKTLTSGKNVTQLNTKVGKYLRKIENMVDIFSFKLSEIFNFSRVCRL